MAAQTSTRKVYFSVVEDVIANVRESFLDEGVDEQVLQELKQLWETKLAASRALEVPEPEPTPGNIPYQLMQPQQSQAQVQPTATIQNQIQMPVQLSADGQISNAASMAFSAQNQMFQHVQALVNVNSGGPITLHQTANGQYILQALPQGVSQAQMVIPQQLLHTQAQIQQLQTHRPGLPQLDGTFDMEHNEEENEKPSHVATNTASDLEVSISRLGECCSDSLPLDGPLAGLGASAVEFELDMSQKLSRRLRQDLRHRRKVKKQVPQLDGNHDTSSSEDDNFDDDDDDDKDDDDKDDEEDEGEEEEPLNSEDDVSEEDPQELFDTDNVVVCQFEKISRNKNKWKVNLKDGIMNLDGKDHVFQKGTGEADW